MTSKNFFNKIGSKLIWILTIMCIVCTSAFLFVACNNSESNDVDDPTYSYSENNEGLISNGSFSYGTSNLDFTTISSLPRVSVTGWTKSSSSSDVNSGVIDVSGNGWKALISKLYDDNDFLTYAQSTFGFSKDAVKDELKESLSSEPTNSQIKEKIIADYFTGEDAKINYFPNPGKPSASADNKVYMLNNYDKDRLGHGISQNITSSSTVKLEKGNYGKFTVSVKTQNLKDYSNSGYGAFIAINNSFNSSSQAQYRIQNIVSNDWKQYTIYVKADQVYDTSVTLVLGLGEGNNNVVEGTAYFDEVKFEHVEKTEYDASVIEDTKYLIYGDKENDVLANSNSTTYLYDMTLDKYLSDSENSIVSNVSSFKKAETVVVTNDYTQSSTGVSGNKFGQATVTDGSILDSEHIADTLENKIISLNKASYTLTYKSNSFTVAPESYVYVEFYVKNQLSKFGSTLVTFDIFEDFENNGIKNAKYKTKAVTSFSDISEDWVKIGLILNNNFTSGNRSFIIDIVIGPTDVATANTAPDYATGTVTITNPLVATGLTAQYDSDEKENQNYNLYSLFSSNSKATVALYAGMQQDFVDDSTNKDIYSFNYSASDIGAIVSRPAVPVNFTGVVYNHIYVMNENEHANLETDINDRTNGKNNSYAGLVNTKYVDDYALNGIKSALDLKSNDKDVQPLMIYNNVADSYGYVGVQKSISASAYAKISVDVRVVGSAVAYVYLVDVSGKTKEIMTFDDDKLALPKTQEMVISLNSEQMDDNGWATVTFYIATGATQKDFRLELWNGDRNGQNKSSGFVFFDNVNINTASAFNEPTNVADAFTVSGNPLYDIGLGIENSAIQYTRKLSDLEKQFNDEQKDTSKLISYKPSYVWAKNDTNVYAIYNTIDPVEVNPYESETEDETESSGCVAKTDPATFWLSFSSILLGVVLFAAIIALMVKNIRRKRKANASDAKSHYKIVSRSRIYKPTIDEKTSTENEIKNENELVEETNEVEEVETETNTDEQTDEYVYGEVQDFGDEE